MGLSITHEPHIFKFLMIIFKSEKKANNLSAIFAFTSFNIQKNGFFYKKKIK
jgi:hypothetical protein